MADFNELLKVLRCERPSRAVLFEMFMNERLYKAGCKERYSKDSSPLSIMRNMVHSFNAFNYDYATVRGSEYGFKTSQNQHGKTVSLNEGYIITDRESFDNYEWQDAKKCDYSALKTIEHDLYKGQKLIVMGPGGVLENVIALMGFDNLCMCIYDDEQLVYDLFERVGSGLVEYYDICAGFESVGALISNDDWGFNTQTMLSSADMRRFVFTWHKKIVDVIHKHGKPAILHSCGNYSMIFDDLLSLNYEARHSYEDNIIPVEKAYLDFKGRMAVLGGIDVNFLINADIDKITTRCKKMIDLSQKYGGYALGSGNSIPDYVPDEKYFAMINSIRE